MLLAKPRRILVHADGIGPGLAFIGGTDQKNVDVGAGIDPRIPHIGPHEVNGSPVRTGTEIHRHGGEGVHAHVLAGHGGPDPLDVGDDPRGRGEDAAAVDRFGKADGGFIRRPGIIDAPGRIHLAARTGLDVDAVVERSGHRRRTDVVGRRPGQSMVGRTCDLDLVGVGRSRDLVGPAVVEVPGEGTSGRGIDPEVVFVQHPIGRRGTLPDLDVRPAFPLVFAVRHRLAPLLADPAHIPPAIQSDGRGGVAVVGAIGAAGRSLPFLPAIEREQSIGAVGLVGISRRPAARIVAVERDRLIRRIDEHRIFALGDVGFGGDGEVMGITNYQ